MSRVSPRAFVAGVTIVAAILRLLYLDRQSIWVDEGLSVALTHTPWREMILTTPHNDAMSPYLVLLRLWIMRFGDSAASLRIPSVIFSVATLPLLYALARRLAGARAAAVTTILFAINVFSIRYAQEARCYSLMVLLVVGSWIFFLRCVETPAPTNYAGYILTSVVGAYTQVFNALSYPAQWISMVWRSHRIKPRLGLVVSVLLVCVLIIPKAMSVLSTDLGQNRWVSSLSPDLILHLVIAFSGSLTTGRGEFLLTGAYLLAAVCGALALILVPRESDRSGNRRRFILLGFAIPVAAVLIVSIVKPSLVNRYLSEALPLFMILCAIGLCRARPRWVGAAGLAAIAVLSFYQDYLYYRYGDGEREGWSAATAYILSHAKSGDAVAFVIAESRWPYDYYLSKSGSADPPQVIFPDWDSQFRFAGIDWASTLDPKRFEPIMLRAIDNAPKRYNRVWLAMWPADAYQQDSNRDIYYRLLTAMSKRLLSAMGRQYRLHSQKDFSEIRVLLYDRAAAPH